MWTIMQNATKQTAIVILLCSGPGRLIQPFRNPEQVSGGGLNSSRQLQPLASPGSSGMKPHLLLPAHQRLGMLSTYPVASSPFPFYPWADREQPTQLILRFISTLVLEGTGGQCMSVLWTCLLLCGVEVLCGMFVTLWGQYIEIYLFVKNISSQKI